MSMISEIKIDYLFPSFQFVIDGFSLQCHRDRSSLEGGRLMYCTNDILVEPVPCHWSLSIPPETLENELFSDVFRGYRKNQLHEIG